MPADDSQPDREQPEDVVKMIEAFLASEEVSEDEKRYVEEEIARIMRRDDTGGL